MKKILVIVALALSSLCASADENYGLMLFDLANGGSVVFKSPGLQIRIIDNSLDILSPGEEGVVIPLSELRGFEFSDVPSGVPEVKPENGLPFEVYTTDGKHLGRFSSLSGLPEGTYILRQEGRTIKTMKR